MNSPHFAFLLPLLALPGLMLAAATLPNLHHLSLSTVWRGFTVLSGSALIVATLALFKVLPLGALDPWLTPSTLSLTLAVLVQLLGTVIGVFSSRYLRGETGQRGYITALAGMLASVQVLLQADHWVVLIAAWAATGFALQHLLCFYTNRPFALLAAHKKRMADRLADVMLIAAATLAWQATGTLSISALPAQLAAAGPSALLEASALCLAVGVILRTALLPVHGWLIQVMEAPTPVSALLHAGVVNLGGFVLIHFAPLFEHTTLARWLLMVFGLATAVLAGMVMLTRISIKVRLAWSTAAQMGFMVLECALGLYTLALLHLLGHSLYKAHTFLAASTIVRNTRLQMLHGPLTKEPLSLWLAPTITIPVVMWLNSLAAEFASHIGSEAWPWWWSVILGLAWAPLLWVPMVSSVHDDQPAPAAERVIGMGLLAVIGLTAATLLGHALPFGLHDSPHGDLGIVAMIGMSLLYLCLVVLQTRPAILATWRRWSYAGFYVDEIYTRLALRLWPTAWIPQRAASRFHTNNNPIEGSVQ